MSVPDGDFELDDGSWSLNDRAEIQSIEVYSGENALDVRSTSDFDGSDQKHGIATVTLTETVGQSTRINFWVNADSAFQDNDGQIFLQYMVSPSGNPSFFTVTGDITINAVAAGWSQVATKDWTPTDANPLFRLRTLLSGSLNTGIDSSWFVDLVTDQSVAIKLSERSVDAMVATLQANLAAALTAIDTDRGDGITLTAPASGDYYKYPKAEIAGSRAQIEVFEDGALEFREASLDHNNARASYSHTLIVRVHYFNIAAAGVDEMYKRGRRYGSAVKTVLVENPRLEDDDDAIQGVQVTDMRVHHVTDGEDADKVVKGVVTLTCNVDSEEIA